MKGHNAVFFIQPCLKPIWCVFRHRVSGRSAILCFERFLIAHGFQILDIRLIVLQRFVCRCGREFGADVVGIAAVAGLPVFYRRAAGGTERERDRRGNIASILQRQRFAVHTVDFLKNKQIYGDGLCVVFVLRQSDMAFHMDLSGLHSVRIVVQNRVAD